MKLWLIQAMPPIEAMKHFHDGRRCAAGSTQTGRGGTEISYWANPFPYLKIMMGLYYIKIY